LTEITDSPQWNRAQSLQQRPSSGGWRVLSAGNDR